MGDGLVDNSDSSILSKCWALAQVASLDKAETAQHRPFRFTSAQGGHSLTSASISSLVFAIKAFLLGASPLWNLGRDTHRGHTSFLNDEVNVCLAWFVYF